ncbi:hypothetical protein [Flavobacterium sp.]|uniref:hypothetical protein n=1 Tax=Flavobacterium sp. TaxID=239 RepID=UPI00261375E9|nr:hypothetical protein [Flavobacterium sp.]
MRLRNLLGYLLVAIASVLITYFIMQPTTDPVSPVPDSQNICMDYDAQKMSTLDADLIHVMTKGYKYNQLEYIQSKSGTIAPKDANAIWFDLETLKKYLYHIEKKSKNVDGTLTDKNLGVRFYYSTYPSNDTVQKYDFKDLKDSSGNLLFKDYEGLHTLVMIPTITIGDQILDFNPLDESTFREGFSQKSNYAYRPGENIPNNQTGALAGTRDMSGQNHGTLYPPGPAVGMGF